VAGNQARLAFNFPFFRKLADQSACRMDDTLVMVVAEVAAAGEALVQQQARLARHAAQQDLVRDERLHGAVYPAEEVVTLGNPARGDQYPAQMATFLVRQFARVVHACCHFLPRNDPRRAR